MPRGKRKLPEQNIREKIAALDTEIELQKQQLATLRETRRALEADQERAEMAALYEVVKASGKSPAEVAALVTAQQ
ncbi:MAG: hypothetical protein RRY21_05735 [Oscillospiraceae bacterium]